MAYSQTTSSDSHIVEYLWKYLYVNGEVNDSIPPRCNVPIAIEYGWISINHSYIYIRNLTDRGQAVERLDADGIGIYGFALKFVNPARTHIFMQYRTQYEILPFYYTEVLSDDTNMDDQTWEKIEYEILKSQIEHVVKFFDKHEDIDRELLSKWIKAVCRTYEESHMYLE